MQGIPRVQDWDCIIIGGGIVGCSAAYYLARQGMRCLIVESEGIAAAQSGRNLGFVRQQGRDFRELELAMEAQAIWRGLSQELSRPTGFVANGNVALVGDEAAGAAFETWTRRAQDFGLDTRMMSAGELKSHVPGLVGEFQGGMYTATDGKADPPLATRALFEAARALGADVAIGRRVDAIETEGGRVSGIRIGGQRLKARMVICAAGAGTSRLVRPLGVNLPQDWIRATVLRTERSPVKIDIGLWALHIGVRQSADGTFHMSNAGGEYDVRWDSIRYARYFLGPLKKKASEVHLNFLNLLGPGFSGSDDVQITDMAHSRTTPRPSPRYAAEAIEEFRRMLPQLAHLKILSAWAGNIENTPDLIPAIGTTKAKEGLLIATGFSGHGFCPGPAAGRALSEIALGNKAPASIAELSPDRFADGTWHAGDAVL